MNFKLAPWWIWIIACAVLLIATEKMPYGYYLLVRIVVFGIAMYLAYAGWGGGMFSRLCSTIFGFVAVLFNPILPIHLSRQTWHPIDIAFALFFAAHLAFVLITRNRVRAF